MKYQPENTQLKGTKRVQQQKKQPYEKPQLGRVSLFADQVLGNCFGINPPTCNDPPPRS